VREEFTAHLSEPGGGEAAHSGHNELHQVALAAARRAVIAMRAAHEIGDDAFHRIEEELDWLEMAGGGR
jgi:CPA1 family monovalent cation:H+ antiporter